MSQSANGPQLPLFERYRPKTFDEVAGQSRAVAVVEQLRSHGGLGGRAYWLAGPSGTGKTTLARLIAAELADECCIEEVDATNLSGARIRRLERQSHVYGLSTGDKHGRFAGWHPISLPANYPLITRYSPVDYPLFAAEFCRLGRRYHDATC